MVDTITQQASDFTSRDFDSWILELRSRASAAFPSWTDFNTPNFGNIILEMFAHTLDVFSFAQDQQFKETRIVWATLRRSMIALGKNVGFDLPGPNPATVDLEVTFADGTARGTDLVIPKGTVVTTVERDVEFDLTADATVPTGSIQITDAAAENARERIYSSVLAGDPNQQLVLPLSPYIDESASGNVVVGGVDVYERAPNNSFLQSGPTDKHFVENVDENDRVTLVFGDGINGDIPSGSVAVAYKTGGGEDGNVEANSLTVFRDGSRFPTLGGEEVQLLVRNPSNASGGLDRMSVEEARIAIPASLRTSGQRSVTRDDFEDNARKVRGVARALMLTSDDDPSIPENSGELYIMPVGGGLPSSQLKTDVYDFIAEEYPPTITFAFSVEDPTLKIFSISAEVYLATGITESVARQAIEDAYEDFFALLNDDGSQNEAIDFGFKIRTERMPAGSAVAELPWSDLFNVMNDAADASGTRVLRKIEEDLFTPADDVTLTDVEFPTLGSITLTNGDTGSPF